MSVLMHMNVISERVNEHARCERDKKQSENEKETNRRMSLEDDMCACYF